MLKSINIIISHSTQLYLKYSLSVFRSSEKNRLKNSWNFRKNLLTLLIISAAYRENLKGFNEKNSYLATALYYDDVGKDSSCRLVLWTFRNIINSSDLYK